LAAQFLPKRDERIDTWGTTIGNRTRDEGDQHQKGGSGGKCGDVVNGYAVDETNIGSGTRWPRR